MMPGPLLAIGIAETPRSGWKTGPIISTGHAIAEIGVVVLLFAGVSFLTDNPIVVRIIGGVGGAALLLMAFTMAWDTLNGKITYQGGEAGSYSNIKLTGKGITTTLVNPYWFIWWATIGLALLVQSKEFGLIGPVVFYFGHILSDFVWYTVVTVLLWNGRKLFMGGALKFLILACACFLVYLGITFIYDSMTGAI